MTEQELFDKIQQILEDKVITNTYSDVINGATVAQLIMLEIDQVTRKVRQQALEEAILQCQYESFTWSDDYSTPAIRCADRVQKLLGQVAPDSDLLDYVEDRNS